MPDLPDPKAHAHPHAGRPARRSSAAESPVGPRRHGQVSYAELAVTSNFTFLTGASHPDELVHQAAKLGHRAVAVTDRNSLAGVVRAHVAAKEVGIPLIVGCRLEFTAPNGLSVLVYPTTRKAYGRLCRLLTLGKRRAPKGECFLTLDDLIEYHEGLLAVVLPPARLSGEESSRLRALRQAFDDDRLSIALARLYGPGSQERARRIAALAEQVNVPLVAVNEVYYHVPERRPLQDVLTCIRHRCTLAEAGFRLFPNGERYLKEPDEMARLFAEYPKAIARTLEIAERARGFELNQLCYEYPDETCPAGQSPMDYLKQLTRQGARKRYPRGVPPKVQSEIAHEFSLIAELQYAPYFLTVHDLVSFARSRGILCQGRGAAANSAVCYCLGITSVDPDRIDVLFERFVSRERNEPPDIDIDFEHERREEVIQYIYDKYGRDRAGLTAEVITYRRRSAVRDVGKALGLCLDAVDRIAKRVDRWERNPFADSSAGEVVAQLEALGFDPADTTIRLLIKLVHEITGFPRHLSQHVGGFVITRGPLSELVPIENAAMKDRTVIEWDKDDIDAMGMLKVDVLGLGMLTCIRKSFELIEQHHGRSLSLATIPAEDPAVYNMLCRADTLGVFQVESRAQMTMLPRLQPRCFYDLVIEVAIVRPGPIIGDMVHPYLRRRNGEEKFDYPSATIKEVLGKTLGVPLFQEQVMALAVKAAGFTPGEAERLRRAITAWTSRDDIARYLSHFIGGMLQNGYSREFAEWCFKRLKGFSQYGFPESHAASFALLVYASAWLKCYYPAVFAAALLNSQPLGFYAPAQIVRDVRDHGVEVRPVDVNRSAWDCTLEAEERDNQARGNEATRQGGNEATRQGRPTNQSRDSHGAADQNRDRYGAEGRGNEATRQGGNEAKNCDREEATGQSRDRKGAVHDARLRHVLAYGRSEDKGHVLRLGMRMIKGLREADARAIVETVKKEGPFASPFDLWRASEVSAATLRILASADAFSSMGLDRQHALWETQKLRGRPLPLFDRLRHKRNPAALPPISPPHEVMRDYHRIGLSLKAHPVSFLRPMLAEMGVVPAAEVKDERRSPFGRPVAVAGVVLVRQRPGTARGVMFMTLEDETGRVDLIVRPHVYKRYRSAAVFAKLILVRGRVERRGAVVHVLATEFEDLEHLATPLPHLSRDFR